MKTAGMHNFARHFRIPVVPESRSDATQCNTMLPDATKTKTPRTNRRIHPFAERNGSLTDALRIHVAR